MENTSNINRLRNSVSFKLAVVAMLSFLLLIPTFFIRNLINERQERRNQTVLEVTSKWGGQQTLFGPVVLIPYEKYEEATKNCYVSRMHYMHLLPDKVEIEGKIDPEIRYRGIYKVLTYRSDISLNGSFSKECFANWPDNPDKIHWDDAIIVIGISDLKGIHDIVRFDWNGDSLTPEGGIPYESSVSTGINASIAIRPDFENSFHMKFALNGSEALYFVPAGKETHAIMKSTWQTPSFDGSLIPDKREVSATGFVAEWNTLFLTRAFPQKWSDRSYEYEIPQSAFGVSLLIPVDIYQKTTRSAKYALLFIGLTFLVIFFLEVFSKKRIHIVQYLLTGAALIIFYSLLLALSEQIVFGLAYLIAAAGTIGLIVTYTHSMFRKTGYTIVTACILTALYSFLFAVLHMEDFALLFGNIGLFIILAIIMFFSRKIDWNNKQGS
jgi:inner membrane protein